jgi:hypothetical protein
MPAVGSSRSIWIVSPSTASMPGMSSYSPSSSGTPVTSARYVET